MPVPRLLLLASTIAPSRVIGGRRADRLANHFARAGWQVTVLTVRELYVPPIDPTLTPPAGCEIVRTHAWMPRVLLKDLAGRVALVRKGAAARAQQSNASPVQAGESQFRRGLQRALRPFEEPDEFEGWRPFALAAMRNRQFDVVLTTVPPPSSLSLAAELARRTGARLVLDYRDPWSELSPPDLRQVHRQAEDAVLARADLVVGVTPDICALLAARTRAPVELVTNGFDAPPFATFAAGNLRPARLVYAGSLAYGRDLEPLVRALSAVRPAITGDQLRIDYAGPHGAGLLAQAHRHGVADAVVDHGELTAAQANGLLRGALAGVVVVSPGFTYAYPGKIFEILGQARPILALAPVDSATARLVRTQQLGWSHAADDVDGLVATVRAALTDPPPRPKNIENLHVDAVMHRYEQLVSGLLKAGPAVSA